MIASSRGPYPSFQTIVESFPKALRGQTARRLRVAPAKYRNPKSEDDAGVALPNPGEVYENALDAPQLASNDSQRTSVRIGASQRANAEWFSAAGNANNALPRADLRDATSQLADARVDSAVAQPFVGIATDEPIASGSDDIFNDSHFDAPRPIDAEYSLDAPVPAPSTDLEALLSASEALLNSGRTISRRRAPILTQTRPATAILTSSPTTAATSQTTAAQPLDRQFDPTVTSSVDSASDLVAHADGRRRLGPLDS